MRYYVNRFRQYIELYDGDRFVGIIDIMEDGMDYNPLSDSIHIHTNGSSTSLIFNPNYDVWEVEEQQYIK